MKFKNYFQVPLVKADGSPKIKEIQYEGADGETHTGLQFEGYASTKQLDRGNDIILPTAFEKQLPEYMENSIVLFRHDHNKEVGSITKATIDDNGLYVTGIVKVDEDNLFQKLRTGVIKTMSIGYYVERADMEEVEIEVDGKEVFATQINNLELFEISLVGVPMNAGASLKDLDGLADDEYKRNFKTNIKQDYYFAKSMKDTIEQAKSASTEEDRGQEDDHIADDEKSAKLLSEPRDLNYEGTETGDWGDVDKTLEAFVAGYYMHSEDEAPEDMPTEVSDLPQSARDWMASKSFLGDPNADTFNEVVALPAVNPTTDALNEGGLDAVISLAPQMDGLTEDQVEAVQEKARMLKESEFPEDETEEDGMDEDKADDTVEIKAEAGSVNAGDFVEWSIEEDTMYGMVSEVSEDGMELTVRLYNMTDDGAVETEETTTVSVELVTVIDTPEMVEEEAMDNEEDGMDEEKQMSQEEIDEVYEKYHDSVNMSASELETWADSECSKEASLDRDPIDRNLTLLQTNKSDWTEDDATEANKTIAFIARMKENLGGESTEELEDGTVCGTKAYISLKNWAFDADKAGLPTGKDMKSEGTKELDADMSIEEMITDIIVPTLGEDEAVFIVSIFPTEFVYNIWNREEGTDIYYRDSWTMEDGQVSIGGEPVEVEPDMSWVDKTKHLKTSDEPENGGETPSVDTDGEQGTKSFEAKSGASTDKAMSLLTEYKALVEEQEKAINAFSEENEKLKEKNAIQSQIIEKARRTVKKWGLAEAIPEPNAKSADPIVAQLMEMKGK